VWALDSFTFQAEGTGGSYSGGSRYLSVFSDSSFSQASYLGTSRQQLNLETTGDLSYTFGGLNVATDNTNFFFFTTWDDVDTSGTIEFSELSQAVGRMRILTGNPQDLNFLANANGSVQNADWEPAGSFTAVPEPATAGLVALGGLALAMRRRKSYRINRSSGRIRSSACTRFVSACTRFLS